jgi:Fe-S-cluster containining protein
MSKRNPRRRKLQEQTRTATKAAPVLRDKESRLHLQLLRGPLSDRDHVDLISPVFKEHWQNELLIGSAHASYELMDGRPTVTAVVNAGRRAMTATSTFAERLLAQAPPGSLACKAGCDHCCYQSVGVTPPEALTIVAHLRSARTAEELQTLSLSVANRREATDGFTSAQRFSPELPCLFLIDAKCSIYEVRPLSCRGMNSLDAEDCRRRLRDPEARRAFLEGKNNGRSFLEPIRAFHAISAGLQLSLSELFGLDMRPLELTGALHLLLNGEPSLFAEWLAGGSAFESARGGDSTGNEAIQNISGLARPSSE